jgi:hypothetical protein
MTLKNKLLTYLGFCPSKESAQNFRERNNTTSLKQSVVGAGFILIVILLVNNIYAGVVTADIISRLFSLIVLGILLAIVAIGGLILNAIKAGPSYDRWRKTTFVGIFIMTFGIGARTGIWFISPTDGWVEIIAEALAISLATTAVQIIGAEAYLRWRKDKE